jgi:hypothetical protein
VRFAGWVGGWAVAQVELQKNVLFSLLRVDGIGGPVRAISSTNAVRFEVFELGRIAGR